MDERIYGQESWFLYVHTSQMQLDGKFVSLAKPQLAWGNHKRTAKDTLVAQCLVLKNEVIWDG
jgi:hypothetical protein